MRFEYIVCLMQSSRITFVNGEWQGTLPFNSADTQAALDSCPWVWDYLASAGAGGWEMVGATSIGITSRQETSSMSSNLFLKRPLL
ncbi:MAG: hypothetical protein AUG51_18660 [Acidobacteria bacterium 13_1_20CM_3_53_8]|nr:MAG: hypothetical protein AUG51_18660 [Acidobacteria bacterium 13_1_20CM_3_53_8]